MKEDVQDPFAEEISIAKKAAYAASEVIKGYFEGDELNIRLKGKNDLLTEADLAAEEKILSVIRENFPDDELLAEESTGVKELSVDRIWIIDPIDGTTNFAHGFPEFGVSIALWENKEPAAAVVLNIPRNECFEAVKGQGAQLNGDPIQVSGITELSDALIATGFPYRDLGMVDPYLSLFRSLMHKTHGLRRPGSASIDLCNVAAGRFDAFYEYGLSPWDVAAGALIIQEAGGMVQDWAGGSNWLMGQRIVAGNAALTTELRNEISQHFEPDQLRAG